MNDKQLLKLMASNMADREGLKVRTWITKNSVRQAKSISKEVNQTYTVFDEEKD